MTLRALGSCHERWAQVRAGTGAVPVVVCATHCGWRKQGCGDSSGKSGSGQAHGSMRLLDDVTDGTDRLRWSDLC